MNWCRLAIYVILILDKLSLGTSKLDHKVYIKATKCTGTDQFFYKNISCYAKSFSRTYSASFMYMLAKAPIISDFKVRFFVIIITLQKFFFPIDRSNCLLQIRSDFPWRGSTARRRDVLAFAWFDTQSSIFYPRGTHFNWFHQLYCARFDSRVSLQCKSSFQKRKIHSF